MTWQRYDVDLNIQSDGSVQVTETQTIQFQGMYQQGFRVIPTDRVTSIDKVSVDGTAYRTSSTDQGLRVDWSFPPTTNATRTFVLKYALHGAIRIYDAGDQLQWKAIYAARPGTVAARAMGLVERWPDGAIHAYLGRGVKAWDVEVWPASDRSSAAH